VKIKAIEAMELPTNLKLQCADNAFKNLKHTLYMAPILAAPALREQMLLYIAATPQVVSVVVVVERAEDGKELPVQCPV
jgi:hypothetical protein